MKHLIKITFGGESSNKILAAIDHTSLTDSGSQVETLLKSDLDAQRDELYLGFKNTIPKGTRNEKPVGQT